jgi:N-acetylmuramoyl-L-alanine amidase
LTEASVNQAIAQAVTADLAGRGARVDLLAEFDGRLAGYSADAFVAIHADSCTAESRYSGVESGYVGVDLSGFKVAGRAGGDKASQELADCLWDRYEAATGLARHPDTISRDMRDYHAFRRIAPTTPAAIIEVGFLKADRELLTAHADRAVAGIVAGIECFLGGLP